MTSNITRATLLALSFFAVPTTLISVSQVPLHRHHRWAFFSTTSRINEILENIQQIREMLEDQSNSNNEEQYTNLMHALDYLLQQLLQNNYAINQNYEMLQLAQQKIDLLQNTLTNSELSQEATLSAILQELTNVITSIGSISITCNCECSGNDSDPIGEVSQPSADPEELQSAEDIDDAQMSAIAWLKTIYRKLAETPIS
jgi:hypothetical protein